MSWGDAEIERITELWKEGCSASQIARALGDKYSRNAVFGKLTRLGVTRVMATRRTKPWSPPQVPRASLHPCTVAIKAAAPLPRADAPLALGGPHEMLTGSVCKFIHGDIQKDDWRMCGHPGHPWCSFHVGIVYAKPQQQTTAPVPESEAA